MSLILNSNRNEYPINSTSNALPKRKSNLSWFSKLNKSKAPTLRKSQINIENEISVEEMIAKAKIHRKANRPLIKLKEFDGNTKFCQCCYLPAEDGEYLRKCNFFENTDKFADYGRGTSLFFSYYRFSTLILAFTLCLTALPSFFLTNHYTNQLIDTCGKLYSINGDNISETFPDCVNFINIEGVSEYFIKNGDWEFKYNGINLKYLRKVYSNISGTDDDVDKVLINYHITTFMALVTLFIINLLYIILLYNINNQYDLSVTSPSDFTIIVSNLHSAFKVFWKNINKINKVIKEAINNFKEDKIQITNYIFNECKNEIEILGLQDYPKDEEINIFDAFNHFIKRKICVNSEGDNFNIYRINICYKINEFMKKEEEIQENKRKIYKINHQKYQIEKNKQLGLEKGERKYFYHRIQKLGIDFFNCSVCEKSQNFTDIQKEIKKLENELKALLEQTENLTKENFSGVVFVTFDNMGEVERIMAPYPKNLLMTIFVWIKNLKYFLCCCCVDKSERDLFFLKRNVAVDVAPEPEDVIFENLQYSAFQRLFRTLLVYFLSIIIILFCFFIILFLNDVQIEKTKNNSNNFVIKYGISISITLVISILNTIFQFILETLTKNEKHISNTDYYLSFSIKLTIFTFLTSGIIPLISSYYHSQSKYDLLLTNMLTLFLSNSILTPIMWSLNFEFLKKKLQICLIKNNYENYTQHELNKIYELLNMNVSYKYSYIFKTLLMSFFYMPIFPLSIGISFFGFLFGYFLEKFNFSMMYKRPEMLNSKICEFYSNYFIINFFMLCLGNYIFLRDNNKSNLWCIANLIIFGILIIIPYNQIFVCDFIGIRESDLKSNQTYEDLSLAFYNDYEKINPMTRKDAIKRFLDNLIKNALISKPDYDKIFQNIDKVNLIETYYKAKKNFAESLLLKAFTKMPEVNNKNRNKKRKTFLERLKEYVKANKTNIINLILSLISQNNNIPSTNIISIEESNINLINDNIDNKEKQPNESQKGKEQKNNSLIIYENPNEENSIKENNFGSEINININNNISVKDNYETLEKKNIRSNKRKLSKKNMDIFIYLIKTEQKKILDYYKNPVLLIMKHMVEGIILNINHNDDEKNENNSDIKEKISNIEEINFDEINTRDNNVEIHTRNKK